MKSPWEKGPRSERGVRRPIVVRTQNDGVPVAARERPAPASYLALSRYRPPVNDRRPEPPRVA